MECMIVFVGFNKNLINFYLLKTKIFELMCINKKIITTALYFSILF